MSGLTTTFFTAIAAGCFLSVVFGIRSIHEHNMDVALNQIDSLLSVPVAFTSPEWINNVKIFYGKQRAAISQTDVCLNSLLALPQKLPYFKSAAAEKNPFANSLNQSCSVFRNKILPLLSGVAAVITLRSWIFITAFPYFHLV